jgi:hypothetical protein
MKKFILSFGILVASVGAVMAQDKKVKAATAQATTTATTAAVETHAPGMPAGNPSSLKPENMDFKADTHDFGTVPEGPAADYEFTFKNTGKEPLLLQNVSASCGCTTPSWSKEPVLPGKTGTVKASFATAGRGGQPFNKTITVTSNAGTKVLTIKGNVEKAPEGSVPQNNSLIKTN